MGQITRSGDDCGEINASRLADGREPEPFFWGDAENADARGGPVYP